MSVFIPKEITLLRIAFLSFSVVVSALSRQSVPTQGDIMVSHASPEYGAAGDEFVVLFNATDGSIDLNGFEVKYITAGGTTGSAGRIFSATTIIASRSHLLLATRDTVRVGSVEVLRDVSMTTGMAATGGQLVVRETASPTNILFALAWGSVTVYAAGMTDAAAWSGDGMLTLTANETTYVRASYNGPNSDYTHIAAAAITEIPSSATAPLPVQMVEFSAASIPQGVLLRWRTATEADNAGWEIERRNVGMMESWTKIGFVEGAGTSTSPREYSFVDATPSATRFAPSAQRIAYRLKQVDRSGAFSYSGEIEVELGLAPEAFSLGDPYPNPFNPETTIEFSLAVPGHATMKVFDVLGREMATLFEGEAESGRAYRRSFNASRLSTGIYIVRLESAGLTAKHKIVYIR